MLHEFLSVLLAMLNLKQVDTFEIMRLGNFGVILTSNDIMACRKGLGNSVISFDLLHMQMFTEIVL